MDKNEVKNIHALCTYDQTFKISAASVTNFKNNFKLWAIQCLWANPLCFSALQMSVLGKGSIRTGAPRGPPGPLSPGPPGSPGAPWNPAGPRGPCGPW